MVEALQKYFRFFKCNQMKKSLRRTYETKFQREYKTKLNLIWQNKCETPKFFCERFEKCRSVLSFDFSSFRIHCSSWCVFPQSTVLTNNISLQKIFDSSWVISFHASFTISKKLHEICIVKSLKVSFNSSWYIGNEI